ncbi:hypothetical protein [Alishewanella tabrizica]|uniref:RCK N-terminal domain-containing protein n=1 Tax=Alishewanella tabrizica TaxID=671278 RepID=A0ABQ2WH17_9ALTE|nr:hypothetical protein [Alishewanella tabrizica]GGW54565.1 hypothetical protein GCM10008111_08160 [Alishewanella tabrizica]
MQRNILNIVAITTLFITCFSISVWGYWLENLGFFEAVYRSIQLLVLNANFDAISLPMSWQLEIARFCLPLFPVLAVVGLLLNYFKRQWLILRSHFFSPDAIFFGIGRTAHAISISLPKSRRLLVVDLTSKNDIIERLMSMHTILFIEADATSSRVLSRLPLMKTKDIYIFTGDDQKDLDIALMICEHINSQASDKTSIPKLIVDVDDHILLQMAQSEPSFAYYRAKGGEIQWFSAQRKAARALLQQFSVLDKPSNPQQTVHVAIVGFDDFQQYVIKQILQTSIYLHANKLHISVFTAEVDTYHRFVMQHASLFSGDKDHLQSPGILPLATLNLFVTDLSATQQQQVKKAVELVGNSFDIVYVHAETDYNALFHSQRIKQAILSLGLSSRIVCMMNGSHFFRLQDAQAFTSKSDEVYKDIYLFHCRESLVQSGENYPGEKMDRLGLIIHNAYKANGLRYELARLNGRDKVIVAELLLEKLYKKCASSNNFNVLVRSLLEQSWNVINNFDLQNWDHFINVTSALYPLSQYEWQSHLAPEFIWSSCSAADHLSIKIRDIGFELNEYISEADKNMEELEEAIADNLEQLKELEHRRFVAERLVDGWVYGPTTERALKINETMVPYKELPEKEEIKDESIVRVLPRLIKEARE